jgi:tRNA-2-methylthio-N6-dimethylallyladenosine synthase
MRDLPKICESIHLPVQSGSDRILAAMNRKYTILEYLDKVEQLRKAIPGIVLTTDIIVGFPGEEEADHTKTEELLRQVQYDGIFAFKYSRRPNTRALALDGHLPERIKDDRLARVFSLQRGITLRKNQDHIGSVQEVLADGSSKKGTTVSGRTRGNKIVNFSAPAHIIGNLVKVRITSAGPNSLTGELCG